MRYAIAILFLCHVCSTQVSLEGFPKGALTAEQTSAFSVNVCNRSGATVTNVKNVVREYTAPTSSNDLDWKAILNDANTLGVSKSESSVLVNNACTPLQITLPEPLAGYVVRIMTHYTDVNGKRQVLRFCRVHEVLHGQDLLAPCGAREQWARANHKLD